MLPLAGRLVLAAVFATAGVAKLAGRQAAARSFVEFGVPKSLAASAVAALALAELLCAVTVVPSGTARFGALGIAGLLTLFVAVILWTLARGRRPACACFGQVKSEPIGPAVLARNTVLWLIAAVVAWDAAPNAAGLQTGATWPDAARVMAASSSASVVAMVALTGLAIVSAVLMSVLRQYGRLLVRVEHIESELGIEPGSEPAGLAVGTAAPAFTVSSLEGVSLSLSEIQSRVKSAVLVFVEPGCAPCGELLPDVAAAQAKSVWLGSSDDASHTGGVDGRVRLSGVAARTAVVVVSQGDVRENRSKMAGVGVRNVFLQRTREVADAYKVVGTPSAVRITNGVVATPLAAGPDAVRALLDDTLSASANAPTLEIGDEVPTQSLRDLDGRVVELGALVRARTLLIFWSPACSYCQEMLERLRVWEGRIDPSELTLLVVSQGSAAANREQALRSRVVLDDSFLVGRLLGVSGTPSAVLIDKGRVASAVAVGASAVFRLATPSRALAAQS
ncbi:MAG: redoxin domain-containing protein [Vicinamibacterales bacterium]